MTDALLPPKPDFEIRRWTAHNASDPNVRSMLLATINDLEAAWKILGRTPTPKLELPQEVKEAMKDIPDVREEAMKSDGLNFAAWDKIAIRHSATTFYRQWDILAAFISRIAGEGSK